MKDDGGVGVRVWVRVEGFLKNKFCTCRVEVHCSGTLNPKF